MLELQNLVWELPDGGSIINGISCKLGSRLTVITGPNGGGKTSLAKLIAGVEKPTSGRILLDGEDIWADPKKIRSVRFRVGLVFQYPEYQLFEETVYRDIAFGPTNMGLTGAELDRRVHDAARFAGLDEGLLQKSPFALSGGQKRRVAIAGVIAMMPRCVVLDEPTAMLDPQGRREVMSVVRELNRKYGITVILITHHMDEAVQAQRVVVMHEGNVLMDGRPREIFTQVDKLRAASLTVPQTIEVLYDLDQQDGEKLPIDALSIEECADILEQEYLN